MEPAKPKNIKRQKESNRTSQAKISGYFTKPKPETPIFPTSNPAIAIFPDAGNSHLATSQSIVTEALTPVLEKDKKDPTERDVIFIEDSPLRSTTIRTPILIQSSPERSPTPARSSIQAAKEVKKPLHPFFAPKPAASKPSTKAGKPDSPTRTQPTVVRGENAPWPSAEDIHCGATRHSRDCPPSIFAPKQAKRPSRSLERSKSSQKTRTRGAGIADFVDLTERTETSILLPLMGKADAIASIPREYRDHPALERLIGQEYSSCQHNRIWNDKYAPKRAVEVLQNNEKAVYLRSWLKELEIQLSDPASSQASRGVKRPRPTIQRDVDRKRRKRRKISEDPFDSVDDFIADDDDEDDIELDGDEDEGDDLSLGDELPRISNASSPLSSLPPSPFLPPLVIPRGTRSRPFAGQVIDSSPSASSAPEPFVINEVVSLPPLIVVTELIPFKDKLTNTILLRGPQGSGKTAAVYACAEELGWKVFEFYPGIGRRSGGGFMNEVGGTGENHRVGGMATILGKADDSFKPAPTLGFLTSPTKGGTRLSQPPIRESSQEITDVRQSLILVEEADILFQSDGNFWPTLINFIRTSRRPIILTCNDSALIPVEDLPLQTVLEFKPCEEGLGTSYLQAISIAEDRPITREYAKDIFMEQAVYFAMEADIPDQPMLPDPSQGRLCDPDLKRAINHLQFQLVGGLPLRVDHDRTTEGLGHWAEEPAIQPQQYLDDQPLTYRKVSPNPDLEGILQLSELMESISFSDAFVDRCLRSVLNLESIDRHGPSGDDVLGHTLLNKVLEPEEAFGVALDPRDEVMAVDVAYHARFLFEQRGYGETARRELLPLSVARTSKDSAKLDLGLAWGFQTLRLALRRSEYQGRIVQALDEKIVLTSCLLPRPGCVLDYIPWMQEMARGMRGEDEWMSSEGRRVLLEEALIPQQD